VVIAIIALLAAILFPVFARAREKAQQSQCMSHQRQLAIGLMLYAQDHDEQLPLPASWQDATGLATDPKVFDCPGTSKKGTPSNPDYGMNAFLYSVNPETGALENVPLGSIDAPSQIELTADLSDRTPTGATDGDPALRALKDRFRNPFPQTFTINGNLNVSTTLARRHSDGCIVSFLDGHVALLKGANLCSGAGPYNIPAGYGRFYADFTQMASTDVARVMRAVWRGDGGYGTSTGTLSGGALQIASGAAIATNSDENGDTNCWMEGSALGPMTLVIECTVDEGARLAIGLVDLSVIGVTVPSSDPHTEHPAQNNILLIDTARDILQVGQLQSFSTLTTYSGYGGNAYLDIPTKYAGARIAIPAGATAFHIILTSSMTRGNTLKFPNTASNWQYLSAENTNLDLNTANVTVATAAGRVVYAGPWLGSSYTIQFNGRFIRALGGAVQITKLLYAGGG